MTDELTSNGKVTYSVKELLQEIRDDVKLLDLKLDSKADKVDVLALDQRVDLLERDSQHARNKQEHRRWFIPIMVSLCLTLISPILWVAINHLFK